MLKGHVELGSIPAHLDRLLDFSPVNYVSRSLVHLSRQPASRGRAFHLQHPMDVWSTSPKARSTVDTSHRLLSDLRTLRRLLLGGRAT